MCLLCFLTQVGVYVGLCACSHTHTHTARKVLDVSTGVGTRLLEGPKIRNPDGLNLGIYVRIYVYKVDMCVYLLGGGMRSMGKTNVL